MSEVWRVPLTPSFERCGIGQIKYYPNSDVFRVYGWHGEEYRDIPRYTLEEFNEQSKGSYPQEAYLLDWYREQFGNGIPPKYTKFAAPQQNRKSQLLLLGETQ